MSVCLLTRCKDEYFIEEFCNYYLNQEIDKIYIIDDDSLDKTIYKNLENNPQIEIIYEKDIVQTDFVNKFYPKIQNLYDWMIYCDVDEFITTKKNSNKTIKEELNSTFKDVDCIKIPWIFFSCNNIEKNPESILETNIYRWNHDEKHENQITKEYKFRCRYNQIEVKCIFKPKFFDKIWDHYPKNPNKIPICVDSIYLNKDEINPGYNNLRENNINNAHLICHHYRIISKENCLNKLKSNIWYKDKYTLDDLMSIDYNEIIDDTLKIKSKKNKIRFIHITKTGGTSIEDFGKNNNFYWGRFDFRLSKKKHKLERDGFWHIPIRYFYVNPFNSNDILFTVVRNPYERIISECFCNHGGLFKKGQFKNVQEFNEYIQDRINKINKFEFLHFLPQHWYTHDENLNQIIPNILKFENLKNEFEEFMKKNDFDIKFDLHANVSKNKIFNINDISRENLDLINEVYHNDFVFFGYDKI